MFFIDTIGISRDINVVLKGLNTKPKQDFTIPSILLSKQHQVDLMKKLSTKAKYSLLLSIGEEGADARTRPQIKSILKNVPYLVIIKAISTEDTTKTCVCGAYCAAEPVEEEGEVSIPYHRNNFLFYFSEDKTIFLDSPATGTEKFGGYQT